MGAGMRAAATAAAVVTGATRPPLMCVGDRVVRCERQRLTLGEVVIERVQGVGAVAADSAGGCRLLFQLAARSRLPAGMRITELPAGQWSALKGDLGLVEVERGGEVVSLSFATDRLSRGLASQIPLRPFAAQPLRGASRMCLELARSCLRQQEQFDAGVGDVLGDTAVELAKLALIEQFCTRRGETVRETVRARIQSYIARNLADPELTIDRIADRMRCTKRYLHKVFSDEVETLNQYIWSQRLELCRARLSQPELADRSITEIAFDCGFSNTAHFSRSFRARFGECPRVYRRLILAN